MKIKDVLQEDSEGFDDPDIDPAMAQRILEVKDSDFGPPMSGADMIEQLFGTPSAPSSVTPKEQTK
jgi:hypothetical protein